MSLEQIGGSVGLTGPAVYRHFPSKQVILETALTTQVENVCAFLANARQREHSPAEQLRVFFDLLGDMTAHHDVSTLWARERFHLDTSGLNDMNESFRVLVDSLASNICAARAGTGTDDARLLSTAALSVFSSTARMRGALAPRRLKQIQRAIVHSILASPLPGSGTTRAARTGGARRQPAARRQRILGAATSLFFARGFRNVRIDEIAAEADVSVAAVYQQYPGKTDILSTILRSGLESLLWMSLDALDGSSQADSLDVLLRVVINYSVSPKGRTLPVALQDAMYLSEADQVSLGRTASDYSAEWTAAIRMHTPDLPRADANALEQAFAGFICQVIATPELRSRPGIQGELSTLAIAFLRPGGLNGPPSGLH